MTRMDELPENAKIKSSFGGENYKKKAEEKVSNYEKVKKGQAAVLEIPGKLPTLNDLINAAKTNIHAYQQFKEDEQEKIGWYIKQQKIPFFKKCEIDITYYRPDRMADIDNISAAAKKLILDSLVDQGTIQDDCWSVVKGFEESFEVDKDNPRTEVIIKEVED